MLGARLAPSATPWTTPCSSLSWIPIYKARAAIEAWRLSGTIRFHGGFQRVSIEASRRATGKEQIAKTPVNTGDPPEPSVGLEPTTPSLPLPPLRADSPCLLGIRCSHVSRDRVRFAEFGTYRGHVFPGGGSARGPSRRRATEGRAPVAALRGNDELKRFSVRGRLSERALAEPQFEDASQRIDDVLTSLGAGVPLAERSRDLRNGASRARTGGSSRRRSSDVATGSWRKRVPRTLADARPLRSQAPYRAYHRRDFHRRHTPHMILAFGRN